MSVCVGICQMDDQQEYCLGCGRSAAQIFGEAEDPPHAPFAHSPSTADADPPLTPSAAPTSSAA